METSNANSKVWHIDDSVRLGELRERFFGGCKLTWNGTRHAAIILGDRLVFVPADSLSGLKTDLATAFAKIVTEISGAHAVPKGLMREILSYEGFDVLGKRSISFRYVPGNKDYTALDGATLTIVIYRQKFDAAPVNDFVDYPSPTLPMEFQSADRAARFQAALLEAREAWSPSGR